MSFPKHASYKLGASKNIGLLPEHWSELPLKRLFKLERREPREGDQIVTAFRDGTVTLRKNRREEGFTNALKETGYQRIHRNDLVIHAMDAFAGAIGVSDSDGKSSPVYSACTPIGEASPKFYGFYLRNLALRGFIESLAKGIRERSTDFRWADASMVSVPVLPREEQLAIVTFLDHETAKIDALIVEQQRLIDLAKERIKTLALSGYQCPSSTQERIGRLVNQISRPVAISDEMTYEPLGLYNRGRGLFHKEVRAGNEMGDSDFFMIEDGDLILSGQFAWEGAVALASSDEKGCVVSHRYPVIRGRSDRCLTEFLLALLWTDHGDFLLNQCSRGAAGRNRPLNLDLLLKEEIRVPDLSMQELIKSLVWKLRALQEECISQQNLASEHKKALISAAVTGQIDVRGLVPEASAA